VKNIHPVEIHHKPVKVYGKGVMIEGNVRKHDLDACLSSPRMPTFVKTGDLLIISFMKFSHMFRDMPSTRLSQFNSHTEKLFGSIVLFTTKLFLP
jgi:hypothetical protein